MQSIILCFLILAKKNSAETEKQTSAVPGGDRHPTALCCGHLEWVPVPPLCPSSYSMPESLHRQHIWDECPASVYSTAWPRPRTSSYFLLNMPRNKYLIPRRSLIFQSTSHSASPSKSGRAAGLSAIPRPASFPTCPNEDLGSQLQPLMNRPLRPLRPQWKLSIKPARMSVETHIQFSPIGNSTEITLEIF